MTVEGDTPSTPRDLVRELDKLIVAIQDANVGVPTGDADPPRRDYQTDYRRLKQRFGALGYYGVADPLIADSNGWMTGDAIDDLTDISADVRETLWRYETNGVDDAMWHFRFMFYAHWGRHARELALYLHALIATEAVFDE